VALRRVACTVVVIVVVTAAACSSDDDVAVDAETTETSTTKSTSTVPVDDTSCWDLLGQTVSPDPPICVTGDGDVQISHGFMSVTCEEGPDLAFIGGDSDPILLYGRVGETWVRYESQADFPQTSGEPYRACRPTEPPCQGDQPPGEPNACPEG
jgi:hypothetical protein